ncbi:DUF2254 family protein [Catelliglobosispora koreensis]|uniref:DUF2254 family protein n=1 Tax=Catelliglobosispora koreensis TaxID=129052 RepID=UPI00037D7131|nr:DUF2254 family protein [Catelliglobosispora koreensis]
MAANAIPAADKDILSALRRRRRLQTGWVQSGYLAAGLLLALFLPRIAVGPTTDAVRVSGMLQAIAGGIIMFTALVFSLLFLVVQHAATAFSPRLVLFRDLPLVWHAMGLFVAVFVFAAVASIVVERTGQVSIVVPAIAIVLVLLSLAVARAVQLSAFAAVQLGPVLQAITLRGLAVLKVLYPHPIQTLSSKKVLPVTDAASRKVLWPRQHAVVRQIDLPAMLALAQTNDCVIVVEAAVGHVLAMGSPVLAIHGNAPDVTDNQLLSLIDTGIDRSFEQDPLLSFRLLSDIALRALSPAVNDPATAVQAINGIEDLLFFLLHRELDVAPVRDSHDHVRVVLNLPTWEHYVRAGTETAAYIKDSPMCQGRLVAMVQRLASQAPADRQLPLREVLSQLS